MATIYSIKGTDSISSSRLNINDNFTNLNTSLVEIHSFFGVASQDLTITGAVTAATGTFSANVGVGGTLSATGLTSVVDFNCSGKVIKVGIAAASATLPSAGQFTKSTYEVIPSVGGATATLENGENGQEILIVCQSTATSGHTFVIIPSSSNIKNVGAGGITLEAGDDTKDFVLLRYVNSEWIIIGVGSGVLVA
jgi:hypothetical protein